ncbi:MAG: hypothetical protein FWD87_00610 [Spirochaetaceae bacterium]|nr:hypothetical protein [Spirochaetaceae bacterium]
MSKRFAFIFLFLFFSFSLYSQPVNITVIAEDVNAWGAGDWGGYNKIVDKDIQQLINIENSQYIEKLMNNRGRSTQVELEKLFFIEDLFFSNIPSMEENVIYRLTYEKDNTSYVVYTISIEPFSLLKFFRIFVRADEDSVGIESNSPQTQQAVEKVEAVAISILEPKDTVLASNDISASPKPLWALVAIIGGAVVVVGAMVLFIVKRRRKGIC